MRNLFDGRYGEQAQQSAGEKTLVKAASDKRRAGNDADKTNRMCSAATPEIADKGYVSSFAD